MKLTLTHNDIVEGVCALLASKGMTAFDPNTVSADFSFKRGTKELELVLDTDPAPVVEKPAAAPKAAAAATGAAASGAAATTAQAPETAAEAPAVTEQAEAPAETQAATTEAPATAAADDDSLFD